jgi:hypothetical protein
VKAAPGEARCVEDVQDGKHAGAIRAKRGRGEELHEGRQSACGTDGLDAADDDAISADRERIALVLGDFPHRAEVRSRMNEGPRLVELVHLMRGY